MLNPVPQDQLYGLWPWVRNGLEAVRAKTAERWLAEEIYSILRVNGAYLYTVEVCDDDVGFVIVQQHNDPDGPCLFIWALWIEPGVGKTIEDGLYEDLEVLARRIKARRIRMHSPRKGWEQRGFFMPVSTIYEREVGL